MTKITKISYMIANLIFFSCYYPCILGLEIWNFFAVGIFDVNILIKVFIVVIFVLIFSVKIHHDQDNCYKGKHLVKDTREVQWFSSLSSWWESCYCGGRLGAGVAKNSTH